MSKVHIEKNTVQETLVIPLYGRKLCTQIFPNLFRDQKAVELIDRLDYDFSALEKQSKSTAHRFGALEVAMRENDLMIEMKEYLACHPKATLVNLGCGLDQTAENCDNGTGTNRSSAETKQIIMDICYVLPLADIVSEGQQFFWICVFSDKKG